MSAKPKTCPGCRTNPRSATALLCPPCWRTVPKSLANDFRRSRDGTRVAAVKAILTWFERERTEPKLF